MYSCIGCILHKSSWQKSSLHSTGHVVQPCTWGIFSCLMHKHHMACPQPLATLLPLMITQVSSTNEVTEIMCAITD